jgi:hypothetical protein
MYRMPEKQQIEHIITWRGRQVLPEEGMLPLRTGRSSTGGFWGKNLLVFFLWPRHKSEH